MVKIELLETKEEKISYLRKINNDLKEYLSILEGISDAVVVLCEGRTVYSNAAMESLTGYSIEDMVLHDWNLNEGENKENEYKSEVKEDKINIDFPVHSIVNIKCKNSSDIEADVKSKPVHIKGYDIIVMTLQQIPKPQGIVFEKTQQLNMAIVEFSPNAIVARIGDRIIYVNNAAVEMFGAVTKENAVGKMPKEFLDIDEQFNKNVLNGEKLKYSYGKVNAYEQSIVRRSDGKLLDLELFLTVISYDNKIVSLVFARDISEKKKAEQYSQTIAQQKFMLDKVHEYDRLRTEFFSNVSHDLRTPLNVILSSIQMVNLMVRDGSFIEKKDKFLNYTEIMNQNSKRILKIINNIIDIARIDSGFMQIYLHKYNIVEVVENITLMVVEYARSKGITIQFDTEVEELMMACDKENIERIMLNLLSNAVKYTNKGGNVLVYVSTNLNEDKVYISVKDNGVGISKDKQEWIFQRFAQEDNSLTRMDEGSGIGLSIVKSLVEMHKGNVSLISQLGKGSEFIVELPIDLKSDDEDDEMLSRNINEKVNGTRVDVEFSDVL